MSNSSFCAPVFASCSSLVCALFVYFIVCSCTSLQFAVCSTNLRFAAHHVLCAPYPLRTFFTKISPSCVEAYSLRLVRVLLRMFWEAGCLRAYLCLLVVRCFVVSLSAAVRGGVLKAGWFPYSGAVCLLLFSNLLCGCGLPCVCIVCSLLLCWCVFKRQNVGLGAGWGFKVSAPIDVVGAGDVCAGPQSARVGRFFHTTRLAAVQNTTYVQCLYRLAKFKTSN